MCSRYAKLLRFMQATTAGGLASKQSRCGKNLGFALLDSQSGKKKHICGFIYILTQTILFPNWYRGIPTFVDFRKPPPSVNGMAPMQLPFLTWGKLKPTNPPAVISSLIFLQKIDLKTGTFVTTQLSYPKRFFFEPAAELARGILPPNRLTCQSDWTTPTPGIRGLHPPFRYVSVGIPIPLNMFGWICLVYILKVLGLQLSGMELSVRNGIVGEEGTIVPPLLCQIKKLLIFNTQNISSMECDVATFVSIY